MAGVDDTEDRCRPYIVSWYRARTGAHRRIIRFWAVGATLLLIGSLLMGGALTHVLGIGPDQRLALGIVGFVLVVVGPTLTAVGITRMMLHDEEALVLLRSDAVVYDTPSGTTAIPWSVLESVEVAEDGSALELRADDGRPPVCVRDEFDLSWTELADEILATQRRALLGILEPAEMLHSPYFARGAE